MRCAVHSHPCQRCGAKTECGGVFEQNYDGWPEVICPEFHLPDGMINLDFICEACEGQSMPSNQRVVVSRCVVGLISMQVCAATDATDEEILAVCNRENKAGTEMGWVKVWRSDDDLYGKVGPVACSDDPSRVHFLVAC